MRIGPIVAVSLFFAAQGLAQGVAGADDEAALARAEIYVETVREEVERLDAIAADTSHPRHGGWTRYVEAGRTEDDPVVLELLRRTSREQFLRYVSSFNDPALSEAERVHMRRLLSSDWISADMENTAWLKDVVAERGWFTISGHGEDASYAAWLLAQHAGHDPAFQEDVLALMEPLARQGEVDAQNYAMLVDRVALLAGRPTRYGTQGFGCAEDGQSYNFAPVEDPEQLDARRAELGLPPHAESATGANQRCREAAG